MSEVKAKRRTPRVAAKAAKAADSIEARAQQAVDWLKTHGSRKNREGMARYAIPTDKAFGVSMTNIQALAERLGPSHELAAALWRTGWYEARVLAAYVEEPARVTPTQMDQWCRDFDNWGTCDTVCFVLFDRTPHAWRKVEQWSKRRDEFVRRAAFALLASLTVHDKRAADGLYLRGLALVEDAATDERHFVKKAVNWALRSIGKRNAALHAEAVKVAKRLSLSSNPAARWVGKDAHKELTGPVVVRRLAGQAARARQ
jgi:3-methyladenine DNA glycosylase AlkD